MRKKEIKEFLEGRKRLNVMVLGDLILDEYIWGKINRISPEAPVPVLESTSENATLGGAANVANNLCSLNCRVFLFGVIGSDAKGKIFKSIVKKRGVNSSGVVVDPVRPTTNKIRIIAQNQQILRIDWEKRTEISEEIEEKL
ncbi:MAG: bifunctional heptose 7-phosphate kinase/heptose 1-phosphate adenyltransferase, partial [Nitrospinota bacterium]